MKGNWVALYNCMIWLLSVFKQNLPVVNGVSKQKKPPGDLVTFARRLYLENVTY